jgi:hypothetical protein
MNVDYFLPTDHRFPELTSSAVDGGRFHLPLRDSPGFTPGSLLPRFVQSAPIYAMLWIIWYMLIVSTLNVVCVCSNM